MGDESQEIGAMVPEEPPLEPAAGRDVDDDDAADREPPSSSFSGEDFLFHLYRGSELLQDNCVPEAKEELEQALRFQPRDVEGQGLLGIVYFRLGLYPRAIRIYQDIVRARPEELTPHVNLALCFLKTGQLSDARESLESVIRRAPQHSRAWGYLGLVFERMGDLAKARASFERAGQAHMARRMDNLLARDTPKQSSDHPERAEVRRAAADAVTEIDSMADPPGAFLKAESGPNDAPPSKSGRWRTLEPGSSPIPPIRPSTSPASIPAPSPLTLEPTRVPSSLVEGSALPLPAAGSFVQSGEGWISLGVEDSIAVRQDLIVALRPEARAFASSVVRQRKRGRDTDENLGDAQRPFLCLEGQGQLLVGSEKPLVSFELEAGFIYLRESLLMLFGGSVRHENGRLSANTADTISMVQLSGRGPVVFERPAGLCSFEVRAEKPAAFLARAVVGWTGRLLAQPLPQKDAPNRAPGFVSFNGDGAVLLASGVLQ